jgi:hypothetical protein
VTALVLYALLAGLFALGWRLVFKVRYLFEIDGLARTYSPRLRPGSTPAGGIRQ